NNGARLAEPGEFTKRAFLNGRIDLAEAEAVMDLISAKTSVARRTAIRQLGGGLSHKIETARDTILSWIAHIELSIDYPEHEDEARNAAEILSECDNLIASLRRLHSTSRVGRIIRDGIRTAIIGRPNVGKSTLLNAILHEDRAIVHETAGTTRDVLTEHVRIADIALTIADTAGLRDTSDPIEKIGIEKTLAAACDAELILYVADATVGITDEDIEIIKGFGSPVIVLVNKSDLLLRDKTLGALPPMPPQGDEAPLTPYILEISAVTGEGIGGVFDCIKKLFLMGGVGEGGEEIIVRERHGELLLRAIEFVESAAGEICAGVPEDLVSVPLRAAYIALGEILGAEMGGDDIVDRIFSEFCLGK
ncbi:MAG: tRNA uridine-5-carboxymethylaminomethyl(34) synthesis GTPase MnmE, partial [Defluviitaleaceae bacterium]|nr:tRNA uridine-5-carboxymethylaminomethyl(34) synthesis GTPase MnmE [Defluviitaleaceae bacterium]